MKRAILVAALFTILLIVLTGCFPGGERYTTETPAGFFWGYLHGLIIIASFIVSLIRDGGGTIYEVYNTGWPYNLGFILGLSSTFGSIKLIFD